MEPPLPSTLAIPPLPFPRGLRVRTWWLWLQIQEVPYPYSTLLKFLSHSTFTVLLFLQEQRFWPSLTSNFFLLHGEADTKDCISNSIQTPGDDNSLVNTWFISHIWKYVPRRLCLSLIIVCSCLRTMLGLWECSKHI